MRTSRIILGLAAGVGVGVLVKRYLDSKFENHRGITQDQIDQLMDHFQGAPLEDGMPKKEPQFNSEVKERSQNGTHSISKSKNY